MIKAAADYFDCLFICVACNYLKLPMILIFKHLIVIFRSLNAKHVYLNVCVCVCIGRHVLDFNLSITDGILFIYIWMKERDREEENFIAWTVRFWSWFIINFICFFSYVKYVVSSTISTLIYQIIHSSFVERRRWKILWTGCVYISSFTHKV